MSTLGILVLALLIDALVGDPKAIWSRIPHPVALIGRSIDFAERNLNTGGAWARKLKGAATVICLVFYGTAIGIGIEFIPYAGWYLSLILTAILVAQRDLAGHVWAVAAALRDDLQGGRRAVSQIVGRDTSAMTEPEVARAAVESAAENFSDGVVAPVFWFVLFGLPGIIVYKAINTADSMIGHKTPRLKDFGWAAARLDDVVNYIPARITAILFLVAGWALDARDMVINDAPTHRSWNAGWPEAAMAGVLGLALSGPRSYAGQRTDEPWVNAKGRKDAGPDDIEAAVMLSWRAWAIMFFTLCVLALVT